jgi:uncharacterized membrane-anchored protein
MTLRATITGLVLVSVLQIGILAFEYLGAVYPLWSDVSVRLKTVPVDPRSLFRGNYAQLRYEISRLPMSLYQGSRSLRENERVYVTLEKGDDGIYSARAILLEPPLQGSFVRGRVKNQWRSKDEIRITYGIEAFFAPKREALALERGLRSGAFAEVGLASNGKAALKSVHVE